MSARFYLYIIFLAPKFLPKCSTPSGIDTTRPLFIADKLYLPGEGVKAIQFSGSLP